MSKASLAKVDFVTAAAGLKNVTVVDGTAGRTNLPEQCCDAIFMRDVYHHFTDPAAMNASVLASLKPGGMLGVLDFGPPPQAPRAPIPRAAVKTVSTASRLPRSNAS